MRNAVPSRPATLLPGFGDMQSSRSAYRVPDCAQKDAFVKFRPYPWLDWSNHAVLKGRPKDRWRLSDAFVVPVPGCGADRRAAGPWISWGFAAGMASPRVLGVNSASTDRRRIFDEYIFFIPNERASLKTGYPETLADSALELLRAEFSDLPVIRVPPKEMLATIAVTREATHF